MQGTDKQVEFAEAIKAASMATLNAKINVYRRKIATMQGAAAERSAKVIDAVEAQIVELTAAQWIDNRREQDIHADVDKLWVILVTQAQAAAVQA